MPKHFQLKHALDAWRRPFEHNAFISKEDLEELESSLLERMAQLQQEGYSVEDAYHEAVRRVGSFGNADTEYRKVFWGKAHREKRLVRELRWRFSLGRHYLTLAGRNLRKQFGYAFINTFGLAVGLACVILIGLFVRFELSYDRFHDNADRIYRIAREDPGSTFLGRSQYAVTAAPLPKTLMDEFAEVEVATQVEPVRAILSTGEDHFYETGLYATEHFFEVFSFTLLRGEKGSVLASPRTIVLTESLAAKYFGEADPVGQSLAYKHGRDEGVLTVSGIVADPPSNSHMAFDYLLSMSTSSTYRFLLGKNEWDSNNYRTYATLQPGVDLDAFEEKLVALATARLSPLPYYQENPERISRFFPQALTSIHLHSNLNFELQENGNRMYVLLLASIGLIILLLACVNYVNLAAARAMVRAREVGVRKVVGAYRGQLMGQFMSETMLLTGIALVGAWGLAQAFLPAFSALAEREITLTWAEDIGFGAALVGIGLLVGLLASLYPAFVLSSIKPAAVLYGRGHQHKRRVWIRNGLVIGQFAVTAALLIGTVVVYQQLDYVQHAATGLDRTHVVSVDVPNREARAQYETLKQRLLTHSGVVEVSGTRFNPIYMYGQTTTSSWEGAEEGEQISLYQNPVLPGFIDLFEIELVAGRPFSEQRTSKEHVELIINQRLADQLAWDDPVGKWLSLQGMHGLVVGVTEDFHFQPFHQGIAPLALYPDTNWFTSVLVRVRPDEVRETLAYMESVVTELAPGYPFEYEFLDDAYNRTYSSETQLGTVVGYFAGLALIIACLGLLGLAAFLTSLRTKEIGVRKVLGASVPDILVLLSKDFTRLVIGALLMGIPLAYIGAEQWLRTFAYRVSFEWYTVALVAGILLLLAWGTVGYHAVRAALTNPVATLRQE